MLQTSAPDQSTKMYLVCTEPGELFYIFNCRGIDRGITETKNYQQFNQDFLLCSTSNRQQDWKNKYFLIWLVEEKRYVYVQCTAPQGLIYISGLQVKEYKSYYCNTSRSAATTIYLCQWDLKY